MKNAFAKKYFIKSISLVLVVLSPSVIAAEDYYSSQLVNQSKHSGSDGFKLVKTKEWPNSTCLIDTGKQIVNPGETTELKVKKDAACNESGVGYSIYTVDDTSNQHLYGYLSHRLGDGKFSVQVSRFCEDRKCVFRDLNPEQKR